MLASRKTKSVNGLCGGGDSFKSHLEHTGTCTLDAKPGGRYSNHFCETLKVLKHVIDILTEAM